MLESAPIGTHADNFFAEPEFSVPAEARRKHMALFGGAGTGKSTLLSNMAVAGLAADTGIQIRTTVSPTTS
jgi:ABC-type sulfate/molybdate transport systems ATPase subunit